MLKFSRIICILLLTIASNCFGEVSLTTLKLSLYTGNTAPYGMPSVNINIQGKVVPVIFDTGTNTAGVMLTKHALQGLHVKFTGKTTCMGALTGRMCLPEFLIPKLEIGSIVLRNVKGLEINKLWGITNNKTFKKTEASRNGTIGYSVISRFNVLLDYKKKVVILYDKKSQSYQFKNWIKLPFDHLYTVLFVNHKAMILYWDTGSVPSIFAKSMVTKTNITRCTKPYNHKGCERFVPNKITTVRGVKFPKTWFNLINMPDRQPYDGTIGANFYLAHEVFFDFSNNKVYIKPN